MATTLPRPATYRTRRAVSAPALVGGLLTCGILISGCAPNAPAPQGASTAAGAGSSTSAERLSLPEPTGEHAVGTQEFQLVDQDRPDPWKPETGPRQLMTSVWYPATGEGGDPARYMSPEVSKATTEPIPVDMPPEGLAGVATNASVDAEPKQGNWPVVVLSPGFSNARGMMTGLAEDLASKGYVVVTVDHTYEAPITFQDGRFTGCARPVPCGKSGDQKFLQRVVENRSQDLSFVLDELTGPNSPWSGSQYIDASRIGSAGHSIGGAAAAATAKNDPRVKAGANMDGTIYAPESLNGLDKPFLFLGSGPRVENPGMDPSWEQAWSQMAGWKRGLLVKDTGHSSFVDTPLFIDQLGLREQYPPDQLPAILGTLPAQRSADITRTYVSSMFDQHLKGQPEPILDGPSPENPEVVFWKNG